MNGTNTQSDKLLSERTIQDVKDCASIVDVVSRYVDLKANKARCPFHPERTASFSVHPSKGIYKCFGCGVSGDAISFVRAMEKLSFADAVTTLADWYGIPTEREAVPLCFRPKPQPKPKPMIEYKTIPLETVAKTQSVAGLEKNPFALFLFDCADRDRFTHADVMQALELYHVGTSKDYKTIFWLLDETRSHAYTGQVIPYNRETGKRVKADKPTWVHTRLGIDNDSTRKSLFGLQLLALPGNEDKPIGILESPKSAVIASLYYGDAMVFLATYGKYGCNLTDPDNCKPLIGRTCVMYPDLKAFDEWVPRAAHLRANGVQDVTVSTVMIDNASPADYDEGSDPDFADYLLQFRKSDLRGEQTQRQAA